MAGLAAEIRRQHRQRLDAGDEGNLTNLLRFGVTFTKK
jgi:hypothetical protein